MDPAVQVGHPKAMSGGNPGLEGESSGMEVCGPDPRKEGANRNGGLMAWGKRLKRGGGITTGRGTPSVRAGVGAMWGSLLVKSSGFGDRPGLHPSSTTNQVDGHG